MKLFSERFLIILSLLFAQVFLVACGNITASINDTSLIPKVSISSIRGKATLVDTSGSPCTTTDAELFTVEANGDISATAVTTAPIQIDGSFEFTDAMGTSADIENSKIQFLIRIASCTRTFSRPVTATTNQDVTVGTTIAEYATHTKTAGVKKFSAVTAKDLSAALATLAAATGFTYKDAFDSISTLSDQQKLTTPLNIATFNDIKNKTEPEITSLTEPVTFAERTAATYSVVASHWYYESTLAYEWTWLSNLESQTASVTFTPNKNTQGARTVNLKVGIDDGSSAIDATKESITRSIALTLPNTFPAIVPTLTLTSAANTNARAVTMNLATGTTPTDRDHCESFSYLALTEENMIAPLLPSAYTITCTTDQNQTIPYTLTSTGDGNKVLRLWAMDSSGNISALAESVSVFLDTQNPVVTIADLPAAIQGGSVNNIAFTYSDLPTGNLDTVKLYFADDGVTFVEVADVTVSPYVWTAPSAVDLTNAKFQIVAVDKAGNSSTDTTAAFKILSTPPVTPVVSLASAALTNSLVTSTNITCESSYAKVIVTESATAPLLTDTNWVNCATPLAHTLASTTDGAKTLYVYARDEAGNISLPGSVNLTLDRTAPSSTIDPITGPFLGGASVDLTWTSTDPHPHATPVTLEYTLDGTTWTQIVTNRADSGTYSWTTPAANSSIVQVRVVAKDILTNSANTTVSNTFTIDSTAPTLVAAQLSVNSGATTTATNFVQMTFRLSDNFGASEFCIKYDDTTTPLAGDTCWESVTSTLAGSQTVAPIVNITNYTYQIGYYPDTYPIYVWAKDHVGLISTLTNAGAGTLARDKATIFYSPGTPPSITSLVAAKRDLPDSPPSYDDLAITSGSSVYIRWTASNTPTALPADAISLYYKINGTSTWTQIATGLPNAQNGSCTVNAGNTATTETGCYVWSGGSPSNSPYQIQIRVKNTLNQTSTTAVGILNGYTVRTLAGNTDPGINGSAKAAVYFPDGVVESTILHQFVIAPNGNMYIHDSRGIIRVKPSDGLNTLMIANTGTISGSGGPVANFTTDTVYALAIDYSGNLLVRTATAIFRIPTTTDNPNVTLVAGLGASTNDGVTPLNYQFTLVPDSGDATKYPMLQPLPNGDIYFNDVKSGIKTMRYLEASSGTIKTIPFSGTANIILPMGDPVLGTPQATSDNLASIDKYNFGMAFDKFTSEIKYFINSATVTFINGGSPNLVRINPLTWADEAQTQPNLGDAFMNFFSHINAYTAGLDGNMYAVSRTSGLVFKFDIPSNTLNIIAGTGTVGNCDDGTQALTCQMTPQDIFVSSTGTIYIMDGGRIRTILKDGTVFTLYGSSPSAGDGQSALTSRLIGTNFIQRSDDGRIQLIQNNSHVIREIATTGEISRIAGNGSLGPITTGTAATSSSLHGYQQFNEFTNIFTVKSTADVYMSDQDGIYLLSRSSGQWSRVVGGGGTVVESANGLNGNQIDMTTDNTRLLGIVGNKLYYSYRKRFNNDEYFGTKTYNIASSYAQAAFEGSNSTTLSPCAGNSPILGCDFIFNPGNRPMSFFNDAGTTLFVPSFYAGTIQHADSGVSRADFNLLGTQYTGGGAYRNIPGPSPAADEVIYYCNNINIIEYSVISETITNTLALPSGLTCTGHNMSYDATNNRLIFLYSQDGITAIGEYQL
jgi:hypothetical protein